MNERRQEIIIRIFRDEYERMMQILEASTMNKRRIIAEYDAGSRGGYNGREIMEISEKLKLEEGLLDGIHKASANKTEITDNGGTPTHETLDLAATLRATHKALAALYHLISFLNTHTSITVNNPRAPMLMSKSEFQKLQEERYLQQEVLDTISVLLADILKRADALGTEKGGQ